MSALWSLSQVSDKIMAVNLVSMASRHKVRLETFLLRLRMFKWKIDSDSLVTCLDDSALSPLEW